MPNPHSQDSGRRKASGAGSRASAAAVTPALSARELIELVHHYRLVPSPILEHFRSHVAARADDAAELARALVESGHLTQWQINRLQSGKGGFTLGKYQLVDKIASGGMGVILKGWHPEQKRTVAIKVLSASLLNRPQAVKRFEREIAAAGALDHPNIVRALDASCVNGIPYLVMEYVEGKTLNRLVEQRGQLPVAWACEFARQTAEGLEHAHQQGLVHRDIKPSNLLLTRKSPTQPLQVKVLDFGLARFTSENPEDQGGTDLTGANQVFGTIDYIAPEQARSAKTADIRADIYSLGCTLYFMLTGNPPFPGNNVIEKLSARIGGNPVPITRYRPDVPEALQQIIARMLARHREQRYQTPQEVAEALRPFASSTITSAESPSEIGQSLAGDLTTSATRSHLTELELDQFLTRLSRDGLEETGSSLLLRQRAANWTPTLAVFVTGAVILMIAVLALLRSHGDNVRQPVPATGQPGATSPTWPLRQDGLLFAWKASASQNSLEPQFVGRAFQDQNGVANFQGGTATLDFLSQPVQAACSRSGEFTLELVFSTDHLEQTGPARIISFSEGHHSRNITLAQHQRELIIRIRTPQTGLNGDNPQVVLGQLSPRTTYHLLISYRDGELVCYRNGRQIRKTDDIRGDLSNWTAQNLLLGDEWNGGGPWHGQIERLAIYDRIHSPTEARESFRIVARSLNSEFPATP